MFLDDAAQSDMILLVGREKWKVPRFTLGDFIDWAAEVDADRLQRATQGMDDVKKFQFIAFQDVPPSGLDELIRLLPSPAAIRRVCTRCFHQGAVIERDSQRLEPPEKLAPDRANLILTANIARLLPLTKKLAACADLSKPADQLVEGDGSTEDPLRLGGTGGSVSTPATGPATSPSSTLPTPEKTPENSPSSDSSA